MSALLNVGEYAALNKLIAFVPCSDTVTHAGTLLQVLNVYASNCRFVAPKVFAASAGVAFCDPHVLAMLSRNSRKFWIPVAVETPAEGGGTVPSRFFVMEYDVSPIGTWN